MGTSSTYGGPGKGLEPDWLLDDSAGDGGGSGGHDGNNDGGRDGGDNNGADTLPGERAPAGQPLSFSGPRASYTRFTNSGRTSALSKAVSGYIASSRGAGGAVRRMPNSVRVASGVAGLASRFATDGPVEALRLFNLQALAGRPVAEVFDALVDELCPDGGTIDEAVARDALIDAIGIFLEQDLGTFGELTPDQLNDFLAEVMTGSIVSKVINEIGTNSLHGSANDNLYRDAEIALRDFTAGAVRDALARSFDANRTMSAERMENNIREIFVDSFEILESMLEAER